MLKSPLNLSLNGDFLIWWNYTILANREIKRRLLQWDLKWRISVVFSQDVFHCFASLNLWIFKVVLRIIYYHVYQVFSLIIQS